MTAPRTSSNQDNLDAVRRRFNQPLSSETLMKKLLILFVIFLTSHVFGVISVVRHASGASALTPTGNTVVGTYGVAPANGNAQIAVVGFASGTATCTGISQTGATWTLADRYQDATELLTVEVWTSPTCTSAGTGVTATLSASNFSREICVVEVAGMGGSITLDKVHHAGGASTTADTGSTATTTQANEIWVSGFNDFETGLQAGSFSAPTNGYTLEVQAQEANQLGNTALCYKVVSATGTAGNALTIDDTAKWVGNAVSFYGAATAKPPAGLLLRGVGLLPPRLRPLSPHLL